MCISYGGKVRIHASALWSTLSSAAGAVAASFGNVKAWGVAAVFNNEEDGEQQDWTLHFCLHKVAAMVALLVEV
jgi:hypothetical protein